MNILSYLSPPDLFVDKDAGDGSEETVQVVPFNLDRCLVLDNGVLCDLWREHKTCERRAVVPISTSILSMCRDNWNY